MLEADLERFYGRDLLVEFDRVGVRRLLVFVAGLPPDAAVNRDGKQWTDDREFAARVGERVDYWGAQTVALLSATAGFKSKGDRQKFLAGLDLPMRITHPERDPEPVAVQKAVTTDLGDLARFFARN